MRLLSIETSCDETAAAIVESSENNDYVKLLSHSLATSLALHATTGGIIPENAARAQIQYIMPTIYETLEKAKIYWDGKNSPDIDAIAVTYGPGLIGSLLVGVETAKTLSYIWNKPLIPVNHLFGHMYANWIELSSSEQNEGDRLLDKRGRDLQKGWTPPTLPAIVLIVSGGHTDLLYMKSHTDIKWIGGTRDDAAGEAFDKIGRLLGLSYPAGPVIEELAKDGDPKKYHFPRPLVGDNSYDFSFSGLKTALLREVENKKLHEKQIQDLARGTQDAIIDVLVKKTLHAAEHYEVSSIILSGGVAANQTMVRTFQEKLQDKKINLYVPPKKFCTDNAAMIGAAAIFRNQKKSWQDISANPQLYFD